MIQFPSKSTLRPRLLRAGTSRACIWLCCQKMQHPWGRFGGATGSAFEFLPALQLTLGIEGQSQKMSPGRRGDRLPYTDSAATTIRTDSKPKRHLGSMLQKPFRHSRAVIQPRRAHRRAKLSHRVVIRVLPDTLLPIRLRRGCTSRIHHDHCRQKQPRRKATPQRISKSFHDRTLPSSRGKSTAPWSYGTSMRSGRESRNLNSRTVFRLC